MRGDNWQSIIFDFDGVIVESADIKTSAFADLYQSYGASIVKEVVRYHKLNGGLSRYKKFHYFQQHLLKRSPLTQSEEEKLDETFSRLVVNAVINSDSVPGADKFIQIEASRIPLFIASGTPEAELNKIVAHRGLNAYFTGVRGSPKSKETIIAEILSAHDFTPERVLMIGDAIIDYQSAKANNLAFLGRVRVGDKNPFPKYVKTVPDLQSLLS
ncbi:MAG: haloacid dehalogenase [Nitrosomonadaceae bacterium]|nr:haloacid dehalogenase [Nitrosomonadaceae bacterium]|tara:strand:+ start:384 stop:1025 length:642 start_codon:yes stop_codon:yes gene_type:complete